ncbi:histidine phosphatase family protein [Spirosoma harenae]
MPTLVFIRHAESEGNQQSHLICGRSNHYSLSATGTQQAKLLGQRLQREGISFDHWFVSPAVRTLQTSELIAESINLPAVRIANQLQEQWMGDWEGELRSAIYLPETLALMNANVWRYKDHNGESQFEVETRMLDFINPLLDLPDSATVGLVTHGMAIKCLLRGIMDFSPGMTHKIRLHNTSLTSLTYKQNEWFIDRVNDYAHLP